MTLEEAAYEKIGNALLTFLQYDYSPEQQAFINHFLENKAQNLDKAGAQKYFGSMPALLEALNTLSDFTAQNKDNPELLADFTNEIDELLTRLTEGDSGIAL